MKAIGIDFGGTNIKGALVDRTLGIIEQVSVPTHPEKGLESTLQNLSEVINTIKEKTKEPISGVGIGAPGVISLDRKVVKNPPNLPGWNEVHLSDEVLKRTGLPCRIENDANLAALGSARFGVGSDFEHFIMVTLGTGVGGGIIYNNRIFRGGNGGAGELGHVIIDYKGPYSNSPTRGGIEAYVGQRFLSKYASELLQASPENPLNEKFSSRWEELEPYDLFLAAKEGNQIAIDVLQSAGEKLGYAIVNYVHTLDIRTIVVSGGVSRAGGWILDSARKTALSLLMEPFREGFSIVFEPRGNEIALLGAGSLAMEEIL